MKTLADYKRYHATSLEDIARMFDRMAEQDDAAAQRALTQ